MNVLLVAGTVFLVIVVLVVAAFAVINLDLMSYTATGSETLNPAGAPIGRALVVYNPGVSGAAKQAAMKIADGLQAKGYTVVLAGVRSAAAADKTGYGIIVAGGPVYFGKVSGSVDAYLTTLPNDVKIGVFGTTGTDKFMESDFASLKSQVASDTRVETAVVKLILDGNEANDCADLVSALV
jgi:flavodoxin